MNKNLHIIEQGLAARHAKSRRFRNKGRGALLFASAMLVWLIASIFLPALSGFTRYEVTLTSDARDLESEGDATNWLQATQRAFDRVLGEDTSIQGRERYTLLGTFAAFELEDAWSAGSPANVTARVALSDAADQYLKHNAGALSDRQKETLDRLQAEGAVQRVLNTEFFTAGDSRAPESAGVMASLVGSLLLVIVAIGIALPIGVMAAVYLEEFATQNTLSDTIEVAINNLAAVPSIIFGLLGLSVYLLLFDLPRSSALVGGLTVALMVLPTIIITTRASLRAVPPSVRMAAVALGASPVQVAMHHVVPYALPGIMTGTILGVARAMGETAPLLMIGMVAFVADIPRGFLDPATAMPVQVYIWASSPELGFAEKTASAILLLLAILMALNALAIYVRNKFEIRW